MKKAFLVFVGFLVSIGLVSWAFANDMIDLVNNTASGALTTTGEVMSWTLGDIIYMFLGLAFIVAIIGIIYWVISYKKAMSKGKR